MKAGALPFNALNVINRILYAHLWWIGSQCKDSRAGVICSRRDTRRRSRAAVFCTRWIFISSRSGRPNNKELQESNFDVTNACTSFAVDFCVKYWRIWPIFRMPNMARLQTLFTWTHIFRAGSMTTPIFLACCEGWMTASPIIITGFDWDFMNFDEKCINSVLPSFSTSPFSWHHDRTSAMHASILCVLMIAIYWR